MIRKILLSTAIVAATSISALAADPVPVEQNVVPIDSGRFDWSGLQVGVSYSHGSGDGDGFEIVHVLEDDSGNALNDVLPGGSYNGNFDLEGDAIGVAASYLFGFGNFYLGPEVTYNSSNLSDKYDPSNAFDDTIHLSVDSYATAAVKIGYAIDRILIFGKAGWAGGDVEAKVTDPGGLAFGTWKETSWHHGHVLGGGVDYAVTNNWIVSVEYNMVDLGEATHTIGGGNSIGSGDPGSGKVKADARFDVWTAKISYKF